jgi:hypothetical protein
VSPRARTLPTLQLVLQQTNWFLLYALPRTFHNSWVPLPPAFSSSHPQQEALFVAAVVWMVATNRPLPCSPRSRVLIPPPPPFRFVVAMATLCVTLRVPSFFLLCPIVPTPPPDSLTARSSTPFGTPPPSPPPWLQQFLRQNPLPHP